MVCVQIYSKDDGGVCSQACRGGMMAAQLQAVQIMGDVHLSHTAVMLMPYVRGDAVCGE